MKIATTTCSLALVLASTIAHLPTANAAVASFTSSSSIRGGAAARLLQSTDGDVTVEEEPEATEEPSVEDEEPSEDSLESLDEEELGRLGLPTERSCTTESGATKVKHECKAKSEEGAEGAETKVEDEIEFEVSAKGDKGICIAVKYEQEIEDDVTETETDAEFEVCFQELLEYTKGENSTDQAYDWGVSDSELQSIPLTNWDDFGEVMTDDTGMSTFTATSPDGFVNMTFTISPAGDGERITANSMKADVRIVNFPWTEGADSYLTLLSDVESKLEVEVDEEIDDELDEVEEAVDMPEEDEPVDEPEPTEADEPEPTEGDPMDEPEPTDEMPDDGGASRFLNKKAPKLKDAKISFGDVVDTIGVNVFGSVTWADTAVAATNDSDAVEVGRAEKIIQVIATKPPEGSERYLQDKTREQIAFSFVGEPAQGSPDIFWDPEAGVGYSADSSTTSGVGALMSSASVIGGLVGTLFLLANV